MTDRRSLHPSTFYEDLFGEAGGGYVAISALDQSRVGEKGAWNDTVEAVSLDGGDVGQAVAEAATRVAGLGETQNVYFTPAPRRTDKRGGIGNTHSLTSLWAEFDAVTSSPGKDPAASFTNVGEVHGMFFQPSFPEATHVISSGNGWHCYWRLEEPLAWPGPDQFTAKLLARWGNFVIDLAARRGKYVDRVFDAARVLRCPGTFNHKSDPPIPVEIVSQTGAVISVGDLDDLLPPLDEFTGELWSQTYDTSGIKAQTVTDWLDAHSTGPHDKAGATRVAEARERVASSKAGGRHDSLLSALASVIQPITGLNVALAIGEVKVAFDEAKPDQDPSEFTNMVRYLIGQRLREAEERAASVVSTADLRRSVPGSPSGIVSLDWRRLGMEETEEEALWIVPGLITKGLNTLQSRAGVGKSFIAFATALGLATGGTVLGYPHPTGEPINVTYFDWEMSPNDVVDRVYTLGFDLDDDDLSHLDYVLYPPFAVDEKAGADEMIDHVLAMDTQVAVFDTMQRAIGAAENDADGWRDAMRHAWTPLKQLGVTVIRLDHLGKEKKRGGRGSSSKRDEADLIWDLTPKGRGAERIVKFTVNKARVILPAGVVEVGWRVDDHGIVTFVADRADPIYHAPSSQVIDIVTRLDEAKVPVEVGRRAARKLLGYRGTDALLGEAVKFRKRRESDFAPPVLEGSENRSQPDSAPPTHRFSESPEKQATTEQKTVRGKNRTASAPPDGAQVHAPGGDYKEPPAHRLGSGPLLCPECGEVSMLPYEDNYSCPDCLALIPQDRYPYPIGDQDETAPSADST